MMCPKISSLGKYRRCCGAAFICTMTALLVCGMTGTGGRLFAEDAGPVRIYSRLVDPREHPDYERRAVRPPDWGIFQNRTQMSSLRGFAIEGDQIVRYAKDLDRYTKTHELGNVIWPNYQMLFRKNLGDVIDEIQRRNLYLHDIWGFVPGSGPEGDWLQFTPPAEALKMFESKLGPRWLGMDVGEQDGRYVGGYASQMYPSSASRLEQYFNFQRHFQRMTEDLGNKTAALLSLNFGHYFLKEGVYTLLGAETAQALPNSQVYYAFIRGAGKQYGVLWFGNASVYNRWGWKAYGDEGADHGPTKGTSLSLLKRLLYSHILYNSAIVGFEGNWFDGESLSPIGRVQQAAGRWIKANGQPGTMLTPVAVMTDFLAGWSFPRHLYTGNTYRVWGNLPYGPGDYLTDNVLELLYPGYQNASYYHDESGFLSPTPYGDAADCLLSDAPAWLLPRYSLVAVTGELAGGAEIRDKLIAYVRGGGNLIITAGNVAKMPDGLAGVRATRAARQFAAKTQVHWNGSSVSEDQSFELLPLDVPVSGKVLARCGEMPAAVELTLGKGRLTVLASPFGIGVESATHGKILNPIDGPLAKPFPLLKHVATLWGDALRGQTLFEAGRNLQVVTCRKESGLYTVGIFNNAFQPAPFSLVSHCGPIKSIRELPLDTSERGAAGQLPPGIALAAIGANGAATIAGGDVRIFEVRLREELATEIPHIVPSPRPRGRILPLRKLYSLKEEILARPTFFEHFDGVLIDWRYLHDRRLESLVHEAGWIGRQKLRLIVDLASGINLYPDLRLVNNIATDYAGSMAAIDDVLAKMKALGSRDLVISLHRQPENNITLEQTTASTAATVREICRRAEAQQAVVYLRIYPEKPPVNLDDAFQTVKRVGAANLRLAPSTAPLLVSGNTLQACAPELRKLIGLWMVGEPRFDADGRMWDVHRPLVDVRANAQERQHLARLAAAAPNAPIVFDALYESHDAEYLDASFVERLLPQTGAEPRR
jgi:hypothetical protein